MVVLRCKSGGIHATELCSWVCLLILLRLTKHTFSFLSVASLSIINSMRFPFFLSFPISQSVSDCVYRHLPEICREVGPSTTTLDTTTFPSHHVSISRMFNFRQRYMTTTAAATGTQQLQGKTVSEVEEDEIDRQCQPKTPVDGCSSDPLIG